jgi:hypothetical protein
VSVGAGTRRSIIALGPCRAAARLALPLGAAKISLVEYLFAAAVLLDSVPNESLLMQMCAGETAEGAGAEDESAGADCASQSSHSDCVLSTLSRLSKSQRAVTQRITNDGKVGPSKRRTGSHE